MTGEIQKIVKDKGYGFVRVRDDGPPRDLFFHYTQLRGLSLCEQILHLRVEFDVTKTVRGEQAFNIRPLD